MPMQNDEMPRAVINSAVFLFLIKNNQILLLKRANTGWKDGEYSVISGHIEGQKTIAEEMVREAEEEAGLIIRSEDLKVVHVVHQMGDREYVDFYLTAEKWEGEPTNLEPEKCDEIKWFSLDDLPNSLVADVRNALTSYQSGSFFSEFDWNDHK